MKASLRKQKAVTEVENLGGVLIPVLLFGFSSMAIVDALAGLGTLSTTGSPFAWEQRVLIPQRLGLSGKPLGSDQDWVAA